MRFAVTLEDLVQNPRAHSLLGQGHHWIIGEWEEQHDLTVVAQNTRLPRGFALKEHWDYLDNRHFPEYWISRSAESTQLCSVEPVCHYIMLNRKPRAVRRRVLALLSQGSLDRNYYSWLNYRPDVVVFTELERREFEQQPWPTRVLDSAAENSETLFEYPPEQQRAAMALAVEPRQDQVFITEKTYAVLARGQLVLSLGAAGTVQRLQNQGFEFPREIDFAYDQVTDLDQRIHSYVEEVERLTRCYTPQEIVEFYEPLRIKNRQRILDLSLVRPRAFRSWCSLVPDWAQWAAAIKNNVR